MAVSDNLRSIIDRQKEVMRELEKEEEKLSKLDIVHENDRLKYEIENLKKQSIIDKEKLSQLSDENARLKTHLFEQITNERSAILQATNKKIDLLFRSDLKGEENRLYLFEVKAKSRIFKMMNSIKKLDTEEQEDIQGKIESLSHYLEEKLNDARDRLTNAYQSFSKEEIAEIERMKNEQISDDTVREILRKNNIETFLGLNILNKVGILFLIIGVIAASQFGYHKVPDSVKGILFFVFGALMLVVGEILNRRKPNIFSLGLTSGGVAVLYAAVALSYFQLEIITMYPTLAICVGVTAIAFFLSQRYQSQTVATFALIGGYLPIISIDGSLILAYGAMIYFVILNLLAMMIATKRKWTITHIIGFALNALGTIYIVLCVTEYNTEQFNILLRNTVTIAYIMFTFAIYAFIPIVSTLRGHLKFKQIDHILLGLNTSINALVMFGFFYTIDFDDYTGILALVFAAIYFSLGQFIRVKMSEEKVVELLFNITGLTFTVLFIPFQFDKTWISIGWLVQGVLLSTFGILKNQKRVALSGLIIGCLCLYSFLYFDLSGFVVLNNSDDLFPYKYFAITLGSVVVLAAFLYKKNFFVDFSIGYKYGVLVNLFFYTWYIINKFNEVFLSKMTLFGVDHDYLTISLMIIATFLLCYFIVRIKIVADKGTNILSILFSAIAILTLFFVTTTLPYFDASDTKLTVNTHLLGSLVLVITNLISVLAIRDAVLTIVKKGLLGIQWFPIIVSSYFVVVLTNNLINQYDIRFDSAIISVIYISLAFLWIWFGFVKRYAYMRRFGLGLSILAITKLFLIDLINLSQQNKIVSYFTFGVILIAISYVYQYFSKKFEERELQITQNK
ncbi:MAG: Protein of unknown function transrane [Bacillales bacterium]|jgi:hypothetical protein|nr:Protein of unknown function transrane [Bacillales bacterium]